VPHKEIFLPVDADQHFVTAHDTKSPFLIKRDRSWIFAIYAQPHRGHAIPCQGCEHPAHEFAGNATAMMGRRDIEFLQFCRRDTFDLRVRTRPERQRAAAYVVCDLCDE
jgi:hypothetical protein